MKKLSKKLLLPVIAIVVALSVILSVSVAVFNSHVVIPFDAAVKGGYTGSAGDFVISLTEEVGLEDGSAYNRVAGSGYSKSYSDWLQLFTPKKFKPTSKKQSVYNLAVEGGFAGTEKQWEKCFTKSVHANGKHGKSAYQRCVELAYTGSREEFVELVLKSNGQLYSLAKRHGFAGPYAKWVTSLYYSSDNYCGYSAPTFSIIKPLVKEKSFVEWLSSVAPTESISDKSVLIYACAVEAGYKGYYTNWVDLVVRSSAFEHVVKLGYQGSKGGFGELVSQFGSIKQLNKALAKSGYKGTDDDTLAILAEKPVGTPSQLAKLYGYKGSEEQLYKDACSVINNKKISKSQKARGLKKAYVNKDKHIIAVIGDQEVDLGETADNYKPKKKLHTVKFVDYDSKTLSVQIVVKGNSAVPPVTPTREGYFFTGWDKDFSKVKSNLTITAVYKKSNKPTLFVSSCSASAGDKSVQVEISVKNNPGILGMQLVLDFNESALKLKSVSNGEAVSSVLSLTKPKVLGTGCNICWDGLEITPTQVKDGCVAVLTFDVSDMASVGEYPISISYNKGDIVDNDLKIIALDTVPGGIKVIK